MRVFSRLDQSTQHSQQTVSFVSFGHVSTVLGTCSLLTTLGTLVPQTLSLPVLGAAVVGFFTPSPSAVCPNVVFSKGPAFLPNTAGSCLAAQCPAPFSPDTAALTLAQRAVLCARWVSAFLPLL